MSAPDENLRPSSGTDLQGAYHVEALIFARRGQAFAKALLNQGGIPAANATQESIAAAKTQIGKMFNDLSERNTLMLDDELRQGVQNAGVR
jgi:hypothetical protein